MITIERLVAAGVSLKQAARFLDPLIVACDRYEINTPLRIAAFIAQARVESTNFLNLEEGLFYRNAARILQIFPSKVKSLAQAQTLVGNPRLLANTVYADRYGNGPVESGDGYRFRGAGIGQLTFRDNFAAAAAGTGRPYLTQPELLHEPPDAALSFAWYWSAKGINAPADAGLIDAVTKKINPGMAAKQERRDAYKLSLEAFT